MITFKKTRNSTRSYGRGMDNAYNPAHYGIFADGAQIGVIYGTRARFMEAPVWIIALGHYREFKRAGSLGDAKAWVAANVDFITL